MFSSAVCLVMESRAKAQWGWGYAVRMLRLGFKEKTECVCLSFGTVTPGMCE